MKEEKSEDRGQGQRIDRLGKRAPHRQQARHDDGAEQPEYERIREESAKHAPL